MKLLEGMNENPPPAVQGLTVGRRETVAVYYEDIWYRGLAVKKAEGMFSMYLLDFGGALVMLLQATCVLSLPPLAILLL